MHSRFLSVEKMVDGGYQPSDMLYCLADDLSPYTFEPTLGYSECHQVAASVTAVNSDHRVGYCVLIQILDHRDRWRFE